MEFEIRLGVPEMLDFWNKLNSKVSAGLASKDEVNYLNKLVKTLQLLKAKLNPLDYTKNPSY